MSRGASDVLVRCQPKPPATTAAAMVYLVDDDAAVLKGLTRLLRSAGLAVDAFDCPRRFLERPEIDVPSCVILDVAMPELNGMELQQALARSGNQLPIIFLTGHGDIPMSVQAMKRGAADFLTKPVKDDELLAAVHAAIEKDRTRRNAEAQITAIRRCYATLTPREREVMMHVIAGHLNKETAARLGTVEKTIKVHRARVMEKMQAQSVAELVRLAERAGIQMA